MLEDLARQAGLTPERADEVAASSFDWAALERALLGPLPLTGLTGGRRRA